MQYQEISNGKFENLSSISKLQTIFPKTASWIWNLKENKLEVSDNFYQLFEFNKEKFTSLTSEIQQFQNALENEISKNKSINFQYEFSDSQGKRKIYNVIGDIKKDSDGNIIQSFGVIKAENPLKNLKDYSEFFLDAIPHAFFLYDSELKFLDTNHRGINLFPPGTSKNDLIGKHILDLVPNLESTGRFEQYLEVIRTGKPNFYENVILNEKFGDKHFNIYAFKFRDALGLIFNDITKINKFQSILAKSKIGSWKWDLRINKVEFSDEACRILRIDNKQNFKNLDFLLELISPEEKEEIIRKFKNFLQFKDKFNDELLLTLSNGKRKTIILDAEIIHDSWMVPKEIIGTLQDISEISLLNHEKNKFAVLFNNIGDGLCIINQNHDIEYINSHLTRQFGPIKQKKCYEYFYKTNINCSWCNTLDLINGKPLEFEYYFNKLDKYFKIIEKTIKNDNEQVIKLLIFRDITKSKKAKEHIKILSKFPSEDPNPVLRIKDHIILYSNHSAKKYLQTKIGDSVPYFLEKLIKETLFNDKANLEEKINNRWFLFNSVLIHPSEYINIYGTDITKRKKYELKLEQIISNVLHQLKTPVSILQMSLSYLKKNEESINKKTKKDLLEGVIRNSRILNELIEGLSILSKYDEKTIKLNFEVFELKNILRDIIMFMEPYISNKNLDIIFEMEDSVEILADKKKINQIFQLLIDNAIKYSEMNGKIELRVIEHYKGIFNAKDKNGILIQVADNGIGIKEKDLPFIFKRFYRSKDVMNIEGSGLGLSIAKNLVNLHGGDIFISQNPEGGSTFSIFLPTIDTSIILFKEDILDNEKNNAG